MDREFQVPLQKRDTQESGLQMQRFENLDALKAVCAFLVLLVHVPFRNELGIYSKAIARMAVPISL